MKKIIIKDDGLNGSSNTPSGYKYLGYDGDIFSEKSGATVSVISGNVKYLELLIEGEDDFVDVPTGIPQITILSNDISATISVTRFSAGEYTLDLGVSNILNSPNIFTISDNIPAGISTIRTTTYDQYIDLEVLDSSGNTDFITKSSSTNTIYGYYLTIKFLHIV
jgi:hypothetical protein